MSKEEKDMSFIIADDSVLVKYNQIWNKIKCKEKWWNAKRKCALHLHSLYNCCFSHVKENNYSQVYLEECKYKIKKMKMAELIGAELESDSSSDSE